MRRVSLMLLFTLGLLAGPAYSQATKDQTPPAEFDLRVGSAKYDVAEGKSFVIVTPKGERVEMTLRRKEVLQFADHGVSFNYDAAMKVTAAKELGVVTITLESTASPLSMIQIHPAAITPEELRDATLQSLRGEFKSRGAEFFESGDKAVKRQFRGGEREGQSTEFLIGGERCRLEVYAFRKGNTVVGVTFQHFASDAELAKRHFSVIAESLQ